MDQRGEFTKCNNKASLCVQPYDYESSNEQWSVLDTDCHALLRAITWNPNMNIHIYIHHKLNIFTHANHVHNLSQLDISGIVSSSQYMCIYTYIYIN